MTIQDVLAAGTYDGRIDASDSTWALIHGSTPNELYALLSTNPAYAQHGADAPKFLNHRYLTEDVPHLLVPVVSFGRLLGIQTPITDCIINLASVINCIDHLKKGRNLDMLGLSGMSIEEILDYI